MMSCYFAPCLWENVSTKGVMGTKKNVPSKKKKKKIQCSNFEVENVVFFFKNSKYIHVWSCFIALSANNNMVKTDLKSVHILEENCFQSSKICAMWNRDTNRAVGRHNFQLHASCSFFAATSAGSLARAVLFTGVWYNSWQNRSQSRCSLKSPAKGLLGYVSFLYTIEWIWYRTFPLNWCFSFKTKIPSH